jgi:hypothetical protein
MITLTNYKRVQGNKQIAFQEHFPVSMLMQFLIVMQYTDFPVGLFAGLLLYQK